MKNYNLIVVGAGGTGTYFLKEIFRFLSNNRKRKSIGEIYIFDGDTVEQKNLSRQCFMEEDIGRNKASVMAEILSGTYDVPAVAFPTYLTSLEQLDKIKGSNPLVVSCVDNHGCRILLEKFFAKEKNIVYFDSANEYATGEVVFAYKKDGKCFGPTRSFYFPDILKGDTRNVTELSCEELNNVAPQHIFTNMLAGNQLCSAVSNLLDEKVTPGFTMFNASDMTSRFIPFSKEMVKSYEK